MKLTPSLELAAAVVLAAGFSLFVGARGAEAQAQPRPAPVRERPPAPGEIEVGEFAVRGPAVSAGFLFGRGQADLSGADDFSRNWFIFNVGMPVSQAFGPHGLFSLEYSFQVATDVDDGTGLRPLQLSAEFEYFTPLDPDATAEISFFGGIGLGWQYFDFDDVGARHFLFGTFQLGSRLYFGLGVFLQLGFSFQRAIGFGDDALDFNYWNFGLLLGIRFA